MLSTSARRRRTTRALDESLFSDLSLSKGFVSPPRVAMVALVGAREVLIDAPSEQIHLDWWVDSASHLASYHGHGCSSSCKMTRLAGFYVSTVGGTVVDDDGG